MFDICPNNNKFKKTGFRAKQFIQVLKSMLFLLENLHIRFEGAVFKEILRDINADIML